MTKDEIQIENEIQAKGLNAPRLTPAQIDAKIASEQFYVFPGTTMTVCALTLRNGYIVTGESAAASPENFDKEIGRKIARENARNKIWALEGYLLRESLAFPTAPPEPIAMRAKVRLSGVNRLTNGEGELHSENLQFRGVSKSEGYGADGLDEDNTFARWTPSLDLRMCVNNPALHEMFKAGDVFYLNFVKAK